MFSSANAVVRLAARRDLADAGGHAQDVGERDVLPAVVRRRDRHVVRDLRVEDGVAVLLGEPQQRHRAPERLGDREHAVAHLAAVGERAVARGAAADVQHAVDHEPAGADGVARGLAVDATERRVAHRRREVGPRPRRDAAAHLLVEPRAQRRLAGDGAGRVGHRRRGPDIRPVVVRAPSPGRSGRESRRPACRRRGRWRRRCTSRCRAGS